MVVELAVYLIRHGYAKRITILTTYLAQLREIRQILRNRNIEAELNDLDHEDLKQEGDAVVLQKSSADSLLRVATVDK